MTLLALDAIKFHRFGLAGREPLLLMLASSLLTFAATRFYTRVARVRRWERQRRRRPPASHGCGQHADAGLRDARDRIPAAGIGVDLLAVGFGTGAAFVLDEFAFGSSPRRVLDARGPTLDRGQHHLDAARPAPADRDLAVRNPRPDRGSADDRLRRVAVSIVLSILTCLKGKLTAGLLSIFLPPIG